MHRVLRDIFSGVDNQSIEAGRVIWVLGSLAFIVSFIAYAGIAIAKGQPFNPIEYGTGFGGGFAAVLAAGGFGIAQKDKALPINQPVLTAEQVDRVEITK